MTSFLIAFLIYGCTEVETPVYDNPYDPLNEEFISPEATIGNNIAENSVLNYTTVSISWEGTNQNSSYSYMLDGYDDTFSDWQIYKSATFSNLDEGDYTFLVKERYSTEIVQALPDSLSFTIDAVTDCALILRRWSIDAATGSTFSVYLDIENVINMKGLTAIIDFQSSDCTLLEVEPVTGTVEGADGLLFIASPLTEANTSGILEINAVCLGSGQGFTGNGTLCRLEFISKTDTQFPINIITSATEMRDTNNDAIEIIIVRGTIVN